MSLGQEPQATPDSTAPDSSRFTVSRIRQLPESCGLGVSGIAPRGDGLWLAPERGRRLSIWNDADDAKCEAIPVEGIPAGFDQESLTLLESGMLAIGTESSGDAPIYLMELGQAKATVARKITVPWKTLGHRPGSNNGIEALCVADGSLVLALEIEITVGGRRYAPLGILDLETSEWRGARVALTSDTGRIAGMDCRSRNGKIEAIAIERHFADRRLIRFDIENDGGSVEAVVALDLEDIPEVRKANPEGVLWRGDTVLVVTDNQYGKLVHGPTLLLELAFKAGSD
ncbi:hypothetical protein ABI59_17645 [Acidobacteria bacterium Mor1]|nr:hypothetical protein ABI59_17645 [Acidobacteria bacterium Mor1]